MMLITPFGSVMCFDHGPPTIDHVFCPWSIVYVKPLGPRSRKWLSMFTNPVEDVIGILFPGRLA